MPRRFATRAEELRHHRKCFELAQELGCTPAQAEARMTLAEMRERRRARCSRRGPVAQARAHSEQETAEVPAHENFGAPWMMRD